jgi:hypothetical protein
LVEELRIGALDGDTASTFGRVSGVAVTEEGGVWVADATAVVIRRFSPDGTFTGNVGRRGQGPGEFQDLSGLQGMADGRVAAYDARLRRVTLFGADGRFLSSFDLRLPCGLFTTGQSFAAGPDGALFVYTCASVPTREQIQAAGGPNAFSYGWLQVSSTGSVLDTLAVPPPDNPEFSLRPGGVFGTGGMSPYTPSTMGALSPLGYLVTARSDQYVLHRSLRDGRTVRIERSWSPVPVRPEERAMFEQVRAWWERRQGPAAGPASRARIPDIKPPFWALDVDEEGRIWVALHQSGFYRPASSRDRSAAASDPGAPAPFDIEWREPLVTDVIEPNGRFLGTMTFPRDRTTIAWAKGEVLWVVELGDFDEAYVVRYRIEQSR